MNVDIHYSDSHLAVASWLNVQLQVFSGSMLNVHPPIIERVRDQLAAAYPGTRIFAFNCIFPGVGLPDPATRQASSVMLAHLNETGGASAYVIEGKGLQVSAMRTFVSVMLMASHAAHPTRVFDNAGTGAVWLAREAEALEVQLGAVELERALAAVCRQQVQSVRQRATG